MVEIVKWYIQLRPGLVRVMLHSPPLEGVRGSGLPCSLLCFCWAGWPQAAWRPWSRRMKRLALWFLRSSWTPTDSAQQQQQQHMTTKPHHPSTGLTSVSVNGSGQYFQTWNLCIFDWYNDWFWYSQESIVQQYKIQASFWGLNWSWRHNVCLDPVSLLKKTI